MKKVADAIAKMVSDRDLKRKEAHGEVSSKPEQEEHQDEPKSLETVCPHCKKTIAEKA